VLANPKCLAAVFSADAVEKKRNTEAVETAPNQLVAARITEHTPARTLPLADVRQAVRERVVAARAAELARQEGARKLTAWQADASSAALPAVQVVSRDQAHNLPAPLLDAVLRADAGKLPAWLGVDLGTQGYAVARVNKRLERPAPAPERQKQEQGQYAQAWTAAENQAYGEWLKARFKAQIKVPRPTADVE
jgi:peptidyl-prolyl cis-trans isomerase D